MSVFINIYPNQIKVTPYQAFANIEIDSTNDTGSVLIYHGDFDNYIYSISDTSDPINSNLEPTQNTYKQLLHHSLDHLFYKDYNYRPLEKFGIFNLNQIRELNKKCTLFSINQTKYLEGIKSESLTLTIVDTISGSIINVRDDGYGNLIDINKENLLFNSLKDYLIAEYNFNECFYYNDDILNSVYPNIYVSSTTGNRYYNRNLNDSSKYHNNAFRYNLTFNENDRGYYGIFNGANSYVKINNNSILNFKREDEFAISFFIKTTDSNKYILTKNGYKTTQQLQRTNSDRKNYSGVINVDVETNYNYYPFQIGINSSGKIFIQQSDGTETITSTSTSTINNNIWHHIICQRTETTLDIIINGILEDSQNISDISYEITNDSNIYIGRLINTYFNGSLDEIKFYNKSLTSTEYLSLATLELNNTFNHYVGNVFYENGFIILTSNYYRNLTDSLDFLLEFKSTKTIYEHEYICRVDASDLNNTMNESITKNGVDILATYTGSYFQPYITTIGLYNEDAQLLAVAKTSHPIPKLENTNMTFVVRFDI